MLLSEIVDIGGETNYGMKVINLVWGTLRLEWNTQLEIPKQKDNMRIYTWENGIGRDKCESPATVIFSQAEW